MALHLTKEEHDNDPPERWNVKKVGKRWQLLNKNGDVIDTFNTKHEAEEHKIKGRWFDLYQKEGRWFNGEQVDNWRPYKVN